MEYQFLTRLIRKRIKIDKKDTLMCCTTVEEKLRAIGERLTQLVNALIRAASHVSVFSGVRIDSVGCVSKDCKADLVDIKKNLYAQQYVDAYVPP